MAKLSYEEALKFFDQFIDLEKITGYSYDHRTFNLQRVEYLLNLRGNPHRKLKSILIAGTKGKGSTAAMIAAVLGEGGYRVGLYTSPHLVSFRERIRIGDKLISEDKVGELAGEIKPCVEELMRGSNFGPPTFFEIYTAIALDYFAQERIDFSVLEVGLGGRLDATNVVNPLVSVITQISYDHIKELGRSLFSIAQEKAGIIKEKGIAISSPQRPTALRAIEKACRERKAKLYLVGKDLHWDKIRFDTYGQELTIKGIYGSYDNLFLPLLGDHQLINATTAIGALELLRFHQIPISDATIRKGLAIVKWPGRLEILQRDPYIVLDGAHNAASAKALKESLISIFSYERLFLILGVSINKDIRGIGRELCPLAHEVILTKAANIRAADPLDLAKEVKGYCQKVTINSEVRAALEYVKSKTTPRDLICITGSLYLVGEVMKMLQEPAIFNRATDPI